MRADPATARSARTGSNDDVTLVVVKAELSLGERLSLELVGEPAALSSFRQSLRRWLSETGRRRPRRSTTSRWPTNEACQNAIEHAYGLSPEPFDVELSRDGDGAIVIAVRDRGGWRESVSEDRGRGLPLMRALMDEVDIEQRPTGSTVVLRRALARGAAERQAVEALGRERGAATAAARGRPRRSSRRPGISSAMSGADRRALPRRRRAPG